MSIRDFWGLRTPVRRSVHLTNRHALILERVMEKFGLRIGQAIEKLIDDPSLRCRVLEELRDEGYDI